MARWLPRCLDSVFAALPSAAEVLAADDGSTDETLALLRARAAVEPRLVVLPAPHAGVSAARNRGLDAACGRYVFFVDPDDAVESDFFTAMVGALEREAADCCICAYSEREDGSDASRDVPLKGDYRFCSSDAVVSRYLPRIFGYSFGDIRAWYAGTPLFTHREMASACRLVYRRSLIEARHIRFDETISLYEDAMFNAEYLLATNSMTCLDRPLYHVTCRTSGAMRSVPRDGARYCRNKLCLLRKRESLNGLCGGRLAPLYAATSVLSVLEILASLARFRLSWREGAGVLKAYLAVPSVRTALRAFPLSPCRPALAAAVLTLRLLIR